MATILGVNRRRQLKSKSRPRRQSLQKPNGVISPRVQKVGGEHFAIVCVDPAKHRSEWMMADYFGNLLIEPQTLQHQGAFFKLAVEQIRQVQQQHDIQDIIVVVERTGNYYLPPQSEPSPAPDLKRASFILLPPSNIGCRLIRATRPTKRTCMPNTERPWLALDCASLSWSLRIGNCSCEHGIAATSSRRRQRWPARFAITCTWRCPAMPTCSIVCSNRPTPLAIARRCDSPAKLVQLGQAGLSQYLRENKIRHQLANDREEFWPGPRKRPMTTSKTGRCTMRSGPICTSFISIFTRKISALEQQLASDLVQTPYVRLLAIPGINVVSAAELAAEMGPIKRYANANAITGRSGLYPSRHQSDQTDNDSGPIIRQANRRLRCVLMRIADNLACHCNYYRGQADLDQSRGIDKRASRVKIAKRFSRLALACVAGDEPMRHPCFKQPDSILEKLRRFHHDA